MEGWRGVEGERWMERANHLFGWREDRKKGGDGGMSSPLGPTKLHPSTYGRIHEIHLNYA